MIGRNSLSSSTFQNEEGQHHVKTDVSAQKRYKIMRGKYTLKTGVLVKQSSSELAVQQQQNIQIKNSLTVHNKMVLNRSKKGHLVRMLSKLKEPMQ